MENPVLYREIGRRTGGDIYIGVVGPVRSGKSTFIQRFMQQLVLPAWEDGAARARAQDELPQPAAGRTIMTTEPKFIPETAVPLQLEGGGECRVRLIDCVGYMVEGAMGHEENDKPRMVKSPWFDHEVPFDKAAETGTRKVIRDHSTIGVVVTTDGSISDIPRAGYQQAEARVIAELEALGKPYVILLNTTSPGSPETARLAAWMQQQYGRAVLPVSCVDLDAAALEAILESVLYEFPVRELDFAMPRWVTMLDSGHWLQSSVYQAALDFAARITRMKDLQAAGAQALDCEAVARSPVTGMDLAEGSDRPGDRGRGRADALHHRAGPGQEGIRAAAGRPGTGGGHRLRHRHAVGGPDAPGTAPDRPAGGPLRCPAGGQRPLHPYYMEQTEV